MKKLLLTLIVLLIVGCYSKPAAFVIPPPPEHDQAMIEIKKIFVGYLRDPDSAQYQIVTIKRGYFNYGLSDGGGIKYNGYIAKIRVNAKNGFGGYTGFKPFMVAFDGSGKAQEIIEPAGFGEFAHPRVTMQ